MAEKWKVPYYQGVAPCGWRTPAYWHPYLREIAVWLETELRVHCCNCPECQGYQVQHGEKVEFWPARPACLPVGKVGRPRRILPHGAAEQEEEEKQCRSSE